MPPATQAPAHNLNNVVVPSESGAASIIAFAERNSGFNLEHVNAKSALEGDIPVAIIPAGKTIASVKRLVDEYATAPDRITGTVALLDERSFVAHVNEQKQPTSRIFCDTRVDPPTFLCVYDYHAVAADGVQRPAFGVHRAKWALAMSKEWEAWVDQADSWMAPAAFAEFLEAHVPDVFWGDNRSDHTNLLISQLELKLASPSSLIALSRNIAINVESQVRQAQTLSSGEIAITYVETHKDGEGKPINVPNAFLIAIPVVTGGPLYQILARLFYRTNGGKIAWKYTLHRTDMVFESALDEICARVAEETERPVFRGSPEQ